MGFRVGFYVLFGIVVNFDLVLFLNLTPGRLLPDGGLHEDSVSLGGRWLTCGVGDSDLVVYGDRCPRCG